MNPFFSVIIPSNRRGGYALARESLAKQAFTDMGLADFEVLAGYPGKDEVIWTELDPRWRWIHDGFEGGYWSLNRIYNKLFKEARGQVIVTLQDFIRVPPYGLQRFYNAYQATGGALITGVGNLYLDLDHLEGSVCWVDPRKKWYSGTKLRPCRAQDHEWNWACMPRGAIEEIGGMDEDLDFLGFGGDQLSAVERLQDCGWSFFIDPMNEIHALRHGRPAAWDEKHVLFNGLYAKRKEELKAAGRWPRLGGENS